MLGALITLLYCIAAVGLGLQVFGKWLLPLDSRAAVGVAGALGLGIVGLITLPIGLIPGGLKWGVYVILAIGLFGLYGLFKHKDKLKGFAPKLKEAELLAGLGLGVCVIFALAGVLSPSISTDWDSIAYHLAVPKMWLQDGKIGYVSFIHHSNFPFTVDNLYIWGLTWGGQHGAKAFQLGFYIFTIISVAGFANMRYGRKAGIWAAVAVATVPVVLWEAGTAYIDVAHGLYAALGVLFITLLPRSGEGDGTSGTYESYKEPALLSAICLGFAAGSKYTGLQAILAAVLTLAVFGFARKQVATYAKSALLIGLVSAAVAAPWYIKTAVYTGNPVFPFFYEKLGGKNWGQFEADIYREEQQTFGVPRTGSPGGIASLPHAILGVAYQPGRYTNPNPRLVTEPPPSGAMGFPFGAIGFPLLAGALFWMFSGRARKFEAELLTWVGISFLMWFVLSQQSRYIIAFAPVLAVLAGGAISRLKAGLALGVGVALQAVATLYILYTTTVSDQLQGVSPAKQKAYMSRLPFYEAAEFMNENIKDGRVALFEEVFGFYLDVPYFWANPGHTTELDYQNLDNADEFVASLKKNGITHVYWNLSLSGRDVAQRMLEVMGFMDVPKPFEEQERAAQMPDPRNRWKVLLAEAVAEGKLKVLQPFPIGADGMRSILFEVVP